MTKQISYDSNAATVKETQAKEFCIGRNNIELFAYKNHAYEVYKSLPMGLSLKALKTIFSDFEIMLSHYSRVLAFRIDLHPKTGSETNQTITSFLKNLLKTLNTKYQCKVIYHCAREQDTADKEHYHLEILLSGHKVKHSAALQILVKTLWENQTLGTVEFIKKPFCIMRRGNKASIKAAIYRSSYLTKERTKDLNGKAKGFISNRLKPAAGFDPSTELMLVDPNITFERNRRKQANKSAPSASITGNITSSRYGWFNRLSHAQQLKECISSRTTSLSHLIDTPMFNPLSQTDQPQLITQRVYEPKTGANDHLNTDQVALVTRTHQ
ncbi:inovirus-type Gp2 protein [Shewanella sp. 4t3-1-2LB]|uniref:YagK/YfjJ domain-containing protein n=1 Tax=Shewanella sp. 4t3-1-2LB TaxID=2817682 RepID=UPI001A984F88|nr:inovirus-type Gp2 protein [Shewanella sp. 4t3-1-2LB]MBO1271961.1 inovirus-type Gp2 protein [Shewanella sp. 4t3-1-2LB]